MKPRKLRDIAEVPGFEHQAIKLKPVEMLAKARKWLRSHGDTVSAWKSTTSASAKRTMDFAARCRAIEMEKRK